MKVLFQWLLASIAIIITAYLLPGVAVEGIVPALILAIVLGGLNLIIRPILVFITLPINIVTLGLFTIVINAALVWLAKFIVPGFFVNNFGWAILFALVLSVVSMVFKKMDKKA